MSHRSDTIAGWLNAVVLVLLGFYLFGPGGPVWSRIARWWEERAKTRELQAAWPELVAAASWLGGRGERVLIEFGDYECKYCQFMDDTIRALLSMHPDLRFGFVHVPIPGHEHAESAARAAICAERTGAFPRMHALLFSTEQWKTRGGLSILAREAAIRDTGEFTRCLGAVSTTQRLAGAASLAKRLRLVGTPTFVSRRGLRLGSVTAQDLYTLTAPSRSARAW